MGVFRVLKNNARITYEKTPVNSYRFWLLVILERCPHCRNKKTHKTVSSRVRFAVR